MFFDGEEAGWIQETERGMTFQYHEAWIDDDERPAIGCNLPKRTEPYSWRGPAPFFMGLLPEGWLHALALDKLKIQADDWFEQILRLCRDCIGAVHVEADDE